MSSRTSTLSDTPEQESLYAKRRKIQVRDITGRFRRLKTQVLVLLLAIYYIVPWLPLGPCPHPPNPPRRRGGWGFRAPPGGA